MKFLVLLHSRIIFKTNRTRLSDSHLTLQQGFRLIILPTFETRSKHPRSPPFNQFLKMMTTTFLFLQISLRMELVKLELNPRTLGQEPKCEPSNPHLNKGVSLLFMVQHTITLPAGLSNSTFKNHATNLRCLCLSHWYLCLEHRALCVYLSWEAATPASASFDLHLFPRQDLGIKLHKFDCVFSLLTSLFSQSPGKRLDHCKSVSTN